MTTRQPFREWRTCSNHECGRTFEARHHSQRYCTTACRTRSTKERGYGADHQAERRRWVSKVQAGDVQCSAPICFMVTRTIAPGSRWELGHNVERTEWVGPQHYLCNRKEPRLRTSSTTMDAASMPTRWEL